jgi:hypothetical protein
MHNTVSSRFSTPVNNNPLANTFSGQQVGNLWETGAQTSGLSPIAKPDKSTVWETTPAFTQQTGSLYTCFPTVLLATVTVQPEQLSPQSTGPIKKTTKFKKKLGDS